VRNKLATKSPTPEQNETKVEQIPKRFSLEAKARKLVVKRLKNQKGKTVRPLNGGARSSRKKKTQPNHTPRTPAGMVCASRENNQRQLMKKKTRISGVLRRADATWQELDQGSNKINEGGSKKRGRGIYKKQRAPWGRDKGAGFVPVGPGKALQRGGLTKKNKVAAGQPGGPKQGTKRSENALLNHMGFVSVRVKTAWNRRGVMVHWGGGVFWVFLGGVLLVRLFFLWGSF